MYNVYKKKCDLVTDRQTDRLTDKVIHRGAPLLKNSLTSIPEKKQPEN